MKQVTIRELRANIKSLLTSLPFQIIDGKSKKVLAEVGVPGDSTSHPEKNIKKIEKELEKIAETKGFWVCEHGMRGRTCKHEKCRQTAIKKGDA